MPIPEEPGILSLREALAWAHRESKTGRSKKTEISHSLANRFMTLLADAGVRIIESGRGNANYFFMDVEGSTWGISPFASHEEWWEKPSDGFKSAQKLRSCEWGVVLFVLPKKEGIWLSGRNFDEYVLRGKQKINAPDVHNAIERGYATTFHDATEFLALLKAPPKRPTKSFLMPKSEKRNG